MYLIIYDGKTKRIIPDSNSFSEFGDDENKNDSSEKSSLYDRPKVLEFFTQFFNKPSSKNYRFSRLLALLCEDLKPKQVEQMISQWASLDQFKIIDGYISGADNYDSYQDASVDIPVYKYVEQIQKSLNELLEALNNHKSVSSVWADRYLERFFAFVKKVIFSPQNIYLNDSAFRKSEFMSVPISFAAEKRPLIQLLPLSQSTVKKTKKERSYYYVYHFPDPFFLNTIRRSYEAAEILQYELVQEFKDDLLIRRLYSSVFEDCVQSALRRFVYLDGQNYRIQMNSHSSELIAFPYNQLSCIREVKPVRLFEKIATYIRNEMIHYADSVFICKICIIGNTEVVGANLERGIYDLCLSLLRWYRRIQPDNLPGSKPILNLQFQIITNSTIVNKEANKRELEILPDENEEENTAHCRFIPCDYKKDFEFATNKITDYIQQNNIIFLMDCPWISTENLVIKENGSLKSYCQQLQNWNYAEDLEMNIRKFDSDIQYFYRGSMMRSMDSQFNRVMMSSDTAAAGEIVRVLKTSLVKRIEDATSAINRKNDGTKLVYIFTSEVEGLDYSRSAFYPFARTEKYDGKNFTILRYGNYEAKPLPLGKEKTEETKKFYIYLWSAIKYISASFAYLDFKNAINECLGKENIQKIDYIGIYRSIATEFTLGDSLTEINCRVLLCDSLDNCLKEIDESLCNLAVKRRLLELAESLLKSIYTGVVFSNENRYGNDAIRNAFLMNLYSSASNVNQMLFWHRYKTWIENDFPFVYQIKFQSNQKLDNYKIRDKEFVEKDFFMDKKVYQLLLNQLERTSQLTIGLETLIRNAGKAFHKKEFRKEIISNILAGCEIVGERKSSVYNNAMKAFWEN